MRMNYVQLYMGISLVGLHETFTAAYMREQIDAYAQGGLISEAERDELVGLLDGVGFSE